MRNPKFIPKRYWNDDIRHLQKKKKFAMVKYFRHMTTENLVEYKRMNAIFKRRLKIERIRAWKDWAETLNPNSSVKDIFRDFRRQSNFRVPKQPNFMFQDHRMVDDYLAKLCKVDSRSASTDIISSSTEDPFTLSESEFVLAQKNDSAPGMDGIKYGDILGFPVHIKKKFFGIG